MPIRLKKIRAATAKRPAPAPIIRTPEPIVRRSSSHPFVHDAHFLARRSDPVRALAFARRGSPRLDRRGLAARQRPRGCVRPGGRQPARERRPQRRPARSRRALARLQQQAERPVRRPRRLAPRQRRRRSGRRPELPAGHEERRRRRGADRRRRRPDLARQRLLHRPGRPAGGRHLVRQATATPSTPASSGASRIRSRPTRPSTSPSCARPRSAATRCRRRPGCATRRC